MPPCYGLPPKYLDDIIELVVNKRKRRESRKREDIDDFKIISKGPLA